MARARRAVVFAAFGLGVASACADVHGTCPPEEGIALQVLGSGGPIADDARASTAYLVWVDGQSRVLIDAGSGSFLRFGEAGANFAELEFIGLSHFHTDHSGDFPALLKSGYFSQRGRPLAVAGPSGNARFPGFGEYLTSLLDEETGAYRYLSGYLDGSGGVVELLPVEVDAAATTPVTVLRNPEQGLQVDALGVPHGIVPAIAFRVSVRDRSIVFSSDQNLSVAAFADFAKDATVLIMHMVIPEDAGAAAKRLHAIPSRLAEVANRAAPETLVVSHFMARSLRDPAKGTEIVQQRFTGEVVLAEDLLCLAQ